MDPNSRLHLNFGNNERNQYSDRAYPTTPSTFPQPVYDGQGGQVGYGQQTPTSNYGAGGYFMNNPYPPQFRQAQKYAQNSPTTQAAYQQSASGYGHNDVTNGLVHQFAHQNLGAGARQAGGYQQSTPSSRVRTPGTPGQGYYPTPPTTGYAVPQGSNDELPEKTPDLLPGHVKRRGSICREYVSNFFKQSVNRARERNQR